MTCVSEVHVDKYLSQLATAWKDIHANTSANATTPALVLFPDLAHNVAHVSRYLVQPGCHVAVLGQPGSGRRTAATLAAGLHGLQVRTCSTHVEDSYGRLRDTLRQSYKEAGLEGKHVAVVVDLGGEDSAGMDLQTYSLIYQHVALGAAERVFWAGELEKTLEAGLAHGPEETGVHAAAVSTQNHGPAKVSQVSCTYSG